jgi:hypothetical protein
MPPPAARLWTKVHYKAKRYPIQIGKMKRCPFMMALRVLPMTLLAFVSPSALAFNSVAGDPILDRFNFDFGTFFYGSGTEVTLNGAYGERGAPIDLEHQLGFKDATRFRLDAYWRFTAHQRLRLIYFSADRSTSRQISKTINYGNATYPVGVTVNSENKVSIAELAYEYDFIVRRNFSLGANVGIHNLDFALGLSANTAASANLAPGSLYQKGAVDGPMPMFGLATIWRVAPSLYFTGDAQFLRVTVHPYSGTLQDYAATLVWQPTRHFGLGVGYDLFRLTASVDATNFRGRLGWRYNGPRAFVSASF